MQAIILAAGMGKRLGELTKNNTKCMITVNGRTLIERLLDQLTTLGLQKVVLVIGYKGSELKQLVGETYKGLPIQYIENPVYNKTNNIYSLSLAKEELRKDDTLLIESDLIVDDEIFKMVVENPYPNLATVDKYETWMDGTMVCLDDENNIVNFVPKKAFRYEDVDTYYKTVNIYKFSKSFSSTHFVPFLDAYTCALGNNEYYEQVLRVITLLDRLDLKALPLTGQRWYEIDDVADRDIAEAVFADSPTKLALYQKRYGGYWRFPSLIDFCYLVNPYFPPEKMKEEMKANFNVLLTEYPSGMGVNSLLAGKYFGLKKEYICVGNGAAELIKSLMGLLKGKIGMVLPTFEEYPNRKDNVNIVSYLPQNDSFSYTADDLINYFGDKSLQALLLINPDNPSGNFIPVKDILKLSQWAADKHILLILDESFVDFSEEGPANSLLENEVLEEYTNLIVVKSISKSYGVPGLRLGVLASSDKSLIEEIQKDVSIWNINSFAEFYMQIYGKYEQDYAKACEKFKAERERFYQELQAVDYLKVIPSQANYFLCEVTGKYSSYELTELLLDKYHIFIKDCAGKSAFQGKNYIRIAIRNEADNNFLVHALKELN